VYGRRFETRCVARLYALERDGLPLRARGPVHVRPGWTYTKVNRCITEGRRAFLARYARIDSGGECERWLPLLSAIVDGEATPEQLLEIRPHLRHCGACRATVRELHATSASLAALLPAAMAPAAADHGHERAAGMFVRLYETVAGGVHERAASAALKIQAAAEAASAGKLAAIAASAAAIAGGGAVVVDGAASADRDHGAGAERAAQRTPAPTDSAANVAVPPGRTTVSSRRPAGHLRAGRRGAASSPRVTASTLRPQPAPSSPPARPPRARRPSRRPRRRPRWSPPAAQSRPRGAASSPRNSEAEPRDGTRSRAAVHSRRHLRPAGNPLRATGVLSV
jgi:hypothetical protein